MVTYHFFSPPKCHYGQSAYYSNILLCIFCILNVGPDVISWSQLLCTEEELAPACVVQCTVQGHEVNSQCTASLCCPSWVSPLYPNGCAEKQSLGPKVLLMALGLDQLLPVLAGWVIGSCQRGAEADVSFVITHLFQTGFARCKCSSLCACSGLDLGIRGAIAGGEKIRFLL